MLGLLLFPDPIVVLLLMFNTSTLFSPQRLTTLVREGFTRLAFAYCTWVTALSRATQSAGSRGTDVRWKRQVPFDQRLLPPPSSSLIQQLQA